MKKKYQAYPEYKDSGIERLKNIPVHWRLTRVKYVAELTPRKPEVDRSLECSFVAMEKLKTDSIVLDEIRQIDTVYDGYTYFAENDILMAKVTPCFENKNIAIAKGLTNEIGFGTSEIYTIRTTEKVNSRFLFYRLQEDGFMDLAIAAMTGAGGLKRVPSETVANYVYASPEDDEQQKIANFLDHETAKIDTLIEKQQQLIKLLKEKRQAVISHAVTKGLNPDVPMRDSGVEWLGEVPEHWCKTFVKYVAKIRYGIGEPPKYQDFGIPLIRATNIRSGKITKVGLVLVNPKDIPEARTVWLETGDIIVVRSGAGTGDSAIIPQEYKGSIAGFDMVIRPTKCLPKFLGHALLSNYVRSNQLDLEKSRAAQPHLNAEELGECFMFMPAEEEQLLISDYIDRNLRKFDELILKAESAIEIIKERRTALISAAVTGKIDVRNWQAPKEETV